MAAATKLDIKNHLLTKSKALGNSKRGLKEVCSDLLNDYGRGPGIMKELAAGTFLAPATLDRMMKLAEAKSGADYRPNADTCERILRFFGTEISFDQVRITGRYNNKPKDEV